MRLFCFYQVDFCVPVEAEINGLDIPEIGMVAYTNFQINKQDYNGFEVSAPAKK